MKKLMLFLIIFLLFAVSVYAKTPKDVLVMAYAFDDIISMDPAEIFEISSAEFAGNIYDRLVAYDVNNISKIYGVVAKQWSVSEDGRTFTFNIADNIRFASGNPLTAEDVVFSLQRAVLLNKTPSFILKQFGLSRDNVKEKIRLKNKYTIELETDRTYAPTLVLYSLTSTIGSIVDKKLVMSHEKNGDYGYEWLKTNSAGSGPFKIKVWKPNEIFILQRNDNYRGEGPKIKNVIVRHIAEPSTQRLLLEKGDIDIARNLGADQIKGVKKNSKINILYAPKGTIYYLGLNQKNPILAKPDVALAMKYLIDYEGIANTILADQAIVHQAFLPIGFLGALEEQPFKLDVDKAKSLLQSSGLSSGFTVSMDTRNTSPLTEIAQSIQNTFSKAGIKLEIIPGDGKQTLTKYRARKHDIYIGVWASDYQDPHSNSDSFVRNQDNSDSAQLTSLAWRNAWSIPELTQKTEAAMMESDMEKRAQMYRELQREVQLNSPFVIMFQKIEAAAMQRNVKGFILGPSFDTNRYNNVAKE